ncbi:unnamed protein product [Victoria cruziana]
MQRDAGQELCVTAALLASAAVAVRGDRSACCAYYDRKRRELRLAIDGSPSQFVDNGRDSYRYNVLT